MTAAKAPPTAEATGALSFDAAPRVVRIEPSRGWVSLNLRDVWAYRELLYFLVWRDVKVKYKQTVVGAAWVMLQPFLTMIIFTVIFGRLAGLSSEGFPYPVFVFAALLPWQLFSNALTSASQSLVANQHLVTKIYFPRLIIPVASTLAGLVDFGVSFTILIGLMLFYGIAPGIAVLTLPLFVLLAMASALAVGLWLSALNAQFRDIGHTIPFLMQFWFFVTPIVYTAGLIPESWRLVYGLNPLAGVVQGFRWALLGQAPAFGPLLAVSVVMTTLLLAGGIIYFRRMEKTFADLI